MNIDRTRVHRLSIVTAIVPSRHLLHHASRFHQRGHVNVLHGMHGWVACSNEHFRCSDGRGEPLAPLLDGVTPFFVELLNE